MKHARAVLFVIVLCLLAACGEQARAPEVAEPQPVAPAPEPSPLSIYFGDWEWTGITYDGTKTLHGLVSMESVRDEKRKWIIGGWVLCESSCPRTPRGRGLLHFNGETNGIELYEELPSGMNVFLNGTAFAPLSRDAQGRFTFTANATLKQCETCRYEMVNVTVTHISDTPTLTTP